MPPPGSSPRALGGDEVHVWFTFPDRWTQAAVLKRCQELLAPEERARQERFAQARHRHQYLITRAFVRSLLSEYAEVAPEAWEFSTNSHGKPAIAAPAGLPPWQFNLSHTNGLIVAAIALGRTVGVDVEDSERSAGRLELARRFFSSSEVAYLQALPETEQRRVFFDFWTLKEAYIKARGLGLAIPLEDFSFHFQVGKPPRIAFSPRLDDDPKAWQFWQGRVLPRFRLALAVGRSGAAEATVLAREWPGPRIW